MSNMLTDHLKDATPQDGDGKPVNKTEMLRGGPATSTPAWDATNKTKQFTSSGDSGPGKDGGVNDLHG